MMGLFKKKTPQQKRAKTLKAKKKAKFRAKNRAKVKKWLKEGKEAVQAGQKYLEDQDVKKTARLKQKTARLKAETEYERARSEREKVRSGSYGASQGSYSTGFGQYSSATGSTFTYGQGYNKPKTPTVKKKKRGKRK